MKRKQAKWRVLKVALVLCALGIACYAALVGLTYYWETHVPPAQGYDGIIVLGAQVLPSGEPSVQLRARMDKAKEYYAKSPCVIVVSGGQGSNEPAPEGDIMRKLLIQEGIPVEHVISDPHSADTQQNIRNAWALLQETGSTQPLIVTSDYHLPRALAIARDQGIQAQGAGSLCRPEAPFWLKNHCREALAWVKYWAIKYLGMKL